MQSWSPSYWACRACDPCWIFIDYLTELKPPRFLETGTSKNFVFLALSNLSYIYVLLITLDLIPAYDLYVTESEVWPIVISLSNPETQLRYSSAGLTSFYASLPE